jgi:hypothetical protein
MTEDLYDLLAREMSRVSLDTVDCPDLFARVAAGVHRRGRRRRAVAAALAVGAVVVAAPALGVGHAGGVPAGSRISASQESARADLALRRANPLDLPSARVNGLELSCLHHPYCRGPV